MTSERHDLPSTQDKRRQLVAQSLGVGNPSRLGHTLPEHADPTRECPIEVSVEDVQTYEHNPRRAPNPKFEEIKESIRTGGLRTPLTVTRAPGAPFFMVEAGGNTRLRALQQLWVETRDPRFGRLTVLFRPWRGHGQVLSAHLAENEQRGDMSFWDKACGFAALKKQLEAERNSVLSLRALEDALHMLGLSVNTASLGLYLFATERLHSLAQGYPALSGLDVKTLQPKLNALKREVMAATQCSEDEVYARAFEPAFVRLASAPSSKPVLNVQAVLEACRSAVQATFGLLGDAEPSPGQSSVQPFALQTSAAGVAQLEDRAARDEVFERMSATAHPWRQVQEFAQYTGLEIPCFGGNAPRFMPDLLDALDEDAIATVSEATHRGAWRLVRALVERAGNVADERDSVPVDESSLVSWMFASKDPAAPAFRALVQALVDARTVDCNSSAKPISGGAS